jgi:hypothetical protein
MGNGRKLWCVTWPRIGTGRNRQFFVDKEDAETLRSQKSIELENQGRAGLSFGERQRAEYLDSADLLKPFGKSIRDAVNFYLPHLQATKRT